MHLTTATMDKGMQAPLKTAAQDAAICLWGLDPRKRTPPGHTRIPTFFTVLFTTAKARKQQEPQATEEWRLEMCRTHSWPMAETLARERSGASCSNRDMDPEMVTLRHQTEKDKKHTISHTGQIS